MIGRDFQEHLKQDTAGYSGDYQDIIREAPAIFSLMSELLSDQNLGQKNRFKLFGAIGYFIVPQDLYPEDTAGPIGYIDDIMLSLYVLRKISEDYSLQEMDHLWSSENKELKVLLNDDFNRLISNNEELFEELLEYSGF